jgi:hypothetical protein
MRPRGDNKKKSLTPLSLIYWVMEACSWEPVVEQTGLGFDFVVDSTIGTSVVDVYYVLHNIVLVDPGGLLPFAASLDT